MQVKKKREGIRFLCIASKRGILQVSDWLRLAFHLAGTCMEINHCPVCSASENLSTPCPKGCRDAGISEVTHCMNRSMEPPPSQKRLCHILSALINNNKNGLNQVKYTF